MTTTASFRANAHLLKLLGDELIGDDRLAIFELVKNAYDADATNVDVKLILNDDEPHIIVWDHNGHGMDKDTILKKWMEIGTDSKRNSNKKRSLRFNRLPLGEKGVGRLAVHKLGSKLIINTKSQNHPEFKIQIDWPSLIGTAGYLEDTKVDIVELNNPEFFNEKETGTRIEIRNLNNQNWSRGDIRRLKRLLTSLISPFESVSDFSVNLTVPGREAELDDVLDASDVLSRAIWRYDFTIDKNGLFSYTYNFNPPSTFHEIIASSCAEDDIRLELVPLTKDEKSLRNKKNKEKKTLQSSDLDMIGPLTGTFYIFLRDRPVLNAQGAYQSVTDYLNEQTGIRIYRDGIRVFNYGEPNDDWLGLNVNRINNPGQKIGTSMVIGGIDLALEESAGLKEKTNREGFDENPHYLRFRCIIQSVIEKFHLLHRDERKIMSEYGKKPKDNADSTARFAENVEKLRDSLKKHGLESEVGGRLDQIEQDYKQMREVTLSSGIAGINLAVIFHEVERGVDDLNESIKNSDSYDSLLERADHLSKLLEGFTPLLRRNEQKKFSIKALVRRVLDLSQYRFKHHNIIASCPIFTNESPDFEVVGPFGLLQAALSNLIDNSIHWTNLKSENEDNIYQPAIRIQTLTDWFAEGPALVVLDNGPGFSISADEAIQPFKTTRPGGMGVGLYYADKVMETIGGRLVISSSDELDLPTGFDGAAVVMIFKKGIN